MISMMLVQYEMDLLLADFQIFGFLVSTNTFAVIKLPAGWQFFYLSFQHVGWS